MGLIPWRNKQEVPVRNEHADQGLSVFDFRRDIHSLFDSFLSNPFFPTPSGARDPWMPSLDLTEDEKKVSVALELPGLDANDIDISVMGNALVIQGEKREEKENKGKDYYHTERRFGSFRRSVELPPGVDLNSFEAEYKNGVLRVTAKKTGAAARKRIPIFSR